MATAAARTGAAQMAAVVSRMAAGGSPMAHVGASNAWQHHGAWIVIGWSVLAVNGPGLSGPDSPDELQGVTNARPVSRSRVL